MNLQNTLEYIASVAQNHPLINSSYVGSIYELNSNTNTKYAVFAVEDIDVTKQSNSLLYNCYLYVVDRVMNDESNTIAVQTMAVNTLQEIINYIEGYSQSLQVYGSYIITPIRQKFSDECAGAYVQLKMVSQNDIGECAFSDDKVVEIFQGKTYLLDNYFTKSETLTLLDGKQDTLTAGENITIVDNVISATGGGDSVWEKDANNNIFPKGNTNVTGINCFVTGLTSKATHRNNISIGYNNENRVNNSILIGVEVKDFDPSGDELGWTNLIAMGNNPIIPPKSLNTSYATWKFPKLIIGGIWGFNRWNTLEQTWNGDLYIKGINGWTGTNATPDGTSHLQGYLSGLDTRITTNTNNIANKQNIPTYTTFNDGDSLTLTDNNIYSGSNIATLTINGTDFTGDCLVQFTTGSTTPNITIIGLVFDVLPTFNSNKYYELGVHNGHCLWVEYDS